MLLKEASYLKYKDTKSLKVKGWKEIYNASIEKRSVIYTNTWVSNFRAKSITTYLKSTIFW